jgi:sigma-B regulation protein RsbU (phosphoserine phosphatase)
MSKRLETHEKNRTAELEQAKEIQTNLLPVTKPDVKGITIEAKYQPAKYVAGDLYDIFNLSDERTAIVILDVCGHGISAALLTGVVKMSIHRHLAENIDLSKAMKSVNSDLLSCMPLGHFVTACVSIWNNKEMSWDYCAAGHPGGVLLKKNLTETLKPTAPLLGVLPESDWPSEKLVLSSGNRIFLYTDGVVEAEISKSGPNILSFEQVILNSSDLDLGEQVSNIMAQTTQETQDDATIVAFKVH